MRFSLAVKVLLPLVFVPALALGQATRTYSDVTEVEETGDLLGTELTVEVAGETVTGTLRHYEGTQPAPIAVAGRLAGDALTLNGSFAEGTVQITARLQDDRVVGTLFYHLTGQTNRVELDLPRVERSRLQKTMRKRT